MRAVAYVRGSRSDVDVQNQIYHIEQWAREKGIEIVRIFSDEDVSGWKVEPLKRPEFSKIFKFCEENNINTIVFYSVDRLARSYFDGVEIVKYFNQKGYKIYFTNDEWLSKIEDPTMQGFMLGFLFFVAEMYAKSVSEKTRTALARKKAEGIKLGRPPLPDKVKKRIIELYKKGYTYEEIRNKILKEGIYRDKDGKPRAPGRGTISKIISEYESR